MKYTIGLDYGSDSCRAVIVNAESGQEIASSVKHYKRWAAGKYCDPQNNQLPLEELLQPLNSQHAHWR